LLDSETKRRIDSARDILVGKVPDPKSQVEQITIALIYKFMDDMDAEAEELGGKRSFFVGEYEKFSWAKLLSPALSGYDMLNLYGESIDKMTRNQGVPQLFRDIFKNAYLPYRDPETLKMFLKVINDFNYDHSEKLGDAFEYLLSVLGSQGDAGQFRTPRHIIDFMVKVLDPQKDESILDPACGTAGFLISAYKHVMASNTPTQPSPKEGKFGGGLTPAERKKLADNIRGYDISPDMVRLSLVNLYLHGFTTPNIFEYDTLASEERWNDTADVILANPPFMSPKGGIMPHKKFSVQSNRSEVLFVDYMAEHLTPNGRAAIIVPEGIIFQSAGAYKQLRKYLIEHNFLWAVVSLPAGAFNPYSGVKTSILLLDKSLAKKTDKVLFVKVENDGFDLGAQRRPIDRNDLPKTLKVLKDYQKTLRVSSAIKESDGKETLRVSPLDGKTASFAPETDSALLVSISALAETGDYNLSVDRYREVIRIGKQTYPTVPLKDLCDDILSGGTPATGNKEFYKGTIPWISSADIIDLKTAEPRRFITQKAIENSATNLIPKGNIIVVTRVSLGKLFLNDFDVCISQDSQGLIVKKDIVLPEYLVLILSKQVQIFKTTSQGSTIQGVTKAQLANLQIPVPPLEIQRLIVDEIASHQRLIDGARQVVEGWKPDVQIELDELLKEAKDEIWKRVPLAEVCEQITDGTHVTPTYTEDGIPFLRVTDITGSNDSKKFISKEEHKQLIKRCKPVKGDVLYSKNGTIGVAKYIDWDWEFSIFVSLAMLKPKRDILDGKYLESFLNSDDAYFQATAHSKSGTVTNLHLVEIKQMEIPLPPLEVQREIVGRIETERAIVHGNRELIRLYEEKVKKVIERVWEG
jgi:type I restriction enzyme M protein